jgi:hypothetical protein
MLASNEHFLGTGYEPCDVTYDQDEDVNNKLHKFQNICGTIMKNLEKENKKG